MAWRTKYEEPHKTENKCVKHMEMGCKQALVLETTPEHKAGIT